MSFLRISAIIFFFFSVCVFDQAFCFDYALFLLHHLFYFLLEKVHWFEVISRNSVSFYTDIKITKIAQVHPSFGAVNVTNCDSFSRPLSLKSGISGK